MNIIQHNYKTNGSLSYRKKTTEIIWHHADSANCTVEDINRWHLNNGWTMIGYNLIVYKDGTVHQGRPINAVGAHASGHNSISIGVCCVGNFENETMGNAQLKACKEVQSYLKALYPNAVTKRHKDVNSTSCPGRNFPFTEISGVVAGNTNVTTSNANGSSDGSTKSNNCIGKGDKGNAVKEMQSMLIACGYSCGKYGADSVFGTSTETAVKAFQKDYGLVCDGLYGVNTKAKLKSVYASKKTSTVTTSKDNWIVRLQKECNAQGFSHQTVDGIPGKNTLAGCPTLKQGASGNITKLLQEKLISLGFSCGSAGADGKFGAGTKTAVIAFQKKHGLSRDGIVGVQTWKKLLGL